MPKSEDVVLQQSKEVILTAESEDVIFQPELDKIQTQDEMQHLPLNPNIAKYTYKANKPAIANWKLKHSYLSLKRKAMERIMQARIQSQSSDENLDRVIESTSLGTLEKLVSTAEVDLPQIAIAKQEVFEREFDSISKLDDLKLLESVSRIETLPAVKSSQIVLQPALVEKIEPATKHEPTYTIKQPDIDDYQYTNRLNIAKPKVYRKGEFQLPNLSFLKNISRKTEVDHHSIRRDAELLEKKLGYFGIKGEVMGVSPGPVITTFEYRPEPGIKISKIVNLADDLALALSAFSIRIVAPIPGKDVMGIEIPNIKKSLVPFIDIVSSEDFMNSKSKLPICLGKDIIGNPVVVELDKMPHLLIAGATGTGKSVGLNAMITSILYKSTPEEVRFLMVDPKRIELSFYNDIPHLLTPVITDMKKATIALQWLVREMDRRYTLLAKSQVRHIEQYNQKIKNNLIGLGYNQSDSEEPDQLPYIVVIIDELADLMMTASRDIEFSLTRLAQMARAAGIHLILATQRPSVDVLTGIIKANFPTRISFQVSSKTDSRTIIDANGAETLLGNGDMLFVPPGTARLTRVHGTYLSEEELMEITSFLKSQGKPEYVLDVITETDEEPTQETTDDDYDDKYNEALEFVAATKQASISGIQRALRVGYNRAARIIDIMEKRGIVGPSDGVKPRRVIVENIEYQ
ncbi:MAG: DNA translocase FtsK [Desulfamplus sp.]|nr:DNA translocase FtsK [Desulfamplus sp.]